MKIITLILTMLFSTCLLANESQEQSADSKNVSKQEEENSELVLTPEEQSSLEDASNAESSLGY